MASSRVSLARLLSGRDQGKQTGPTAPMESAMKMMAAAFAGVLLLSGAAMAKEATTTLKVGGWHCGGCAGKTEVALKKVNGVKEAKSDAVAKTVTVTYDDATATPVDLEKAVTALNYKVEK